MLDVPIGNLPSESPREGCFTCYCDELDLELCSSLRRTSTLVEHQLEGKR